MNKQIAIIASIMMSFVFGVGWAQIIDIPDANFKNALLNTNCADFNGDGNFTSQVDLNNDDEIQLSEISGIQGLRVWNQNITSIVGIENFVDLTLLDITFNSIQTMDISALTNLTDLLCYGNELSALDVSNNFNLENLYCNENQLTELDVSALTNLVNLEFYFNNISEIDVTLNTNLETLYCANNPISELDVTNNSFLRILLMGDTEITEVDLSNNVALEELFAENNDISLIDLSQNINLLSVYLYNNLLTEIDVSNNPDIFELNVENNNLINANIKNGTAFMVYSGFFGNPNIEFICADDFEIANVQAELDALGYTETMVSDDCSLSLNEVSLSSKLQAFPIPFQNQLFVNSVTPIEKITIFEMNGQQVFAVHGSGLSSTLDLTELASGFYILKVKTSKGVEIKNIIKQ